MHSFSNFAILSPLSRNWHQHRKNKLQKKVVAYIKNCMRTCHEALARIIIGFIAENTLEQLVIHPALSTWRLEEFKYFSK